MTSDLHDVVWQGKTAYINSEMLTPSADTMPLGIIVERTQEGGIKGEIYFGQGVSAAERTALTVQGQTFFGTRLEPASVPSASGR